MTVKQSGNANLHKARKARLDEFYTRIEDVEAELYHYRDHFQDKTVYLNCDDQSSAFWQYFSGRFDDLGLRRLVATKYPDGLQFRQDRGEGLQVIQLEGDGDFRSAECVEMLKQSGIVVTNPPFSLFREYVAQLIEHDKKFLILGNMNAITYKGVWPLIQGGQLWLGSTNFNNGMFFEVSPGWEYSASYNFPREMDGRPVCRVASICWFTNLDHARRHEELPLWKRYTPEEYPKYDNYDAINVNKVKEIPQDYDGVMGVPITFLDKFNPDQFEILGASDNGAVPDTMKLSHFKAHNEPYVGGKKVYKRIFVKRVM